MDKTVIDFKKRQNAKVIESYLADIVELREKISAILPSDNSYHMIAILTALAEAAKNQIIDKSNNVDDLKQWSEHADDIYCDILSDVDKIIESSCTQNW